MLYDSTSNKEHCMSILTGIFVVLFSEGSLSVLLSTEVVDVSEPTDNADKLSLLSRSCPLLSFSLLDFCITVFWLSLLLLRLSLLFVELFTLLCVSSPEVLVRDARPPSLLLFFWISEEAVVDLGEELPGDLGDRGGEVIDDL